MSNIRHTSQEPKSLDEFADLMEDVRPHGY